MQDYEYHREIEPLIHLYKNFPLPVAIYSPLQQVCWSNSLTKASIPALSSCKGIAGILAEYDPDELERRFQADGCCFIADALPFSGINLCLQPAPTRHRGDIILTVMGTGLSMPPQAGTMVGGSGRALDQSIRKAVSSIFDTMDSASLKADLIENRWIKPSLGKIRIESYGLLRIAENVSEYAKILGGSLQGLSMETLDLAELLNDIHHIASQLLLELDIPLSINLPDGYCMVRGSRSYLELALFNLLHNSLYFTKPGNEINIRLWHTGEQVCLSIHDKGAGIPAHIQPYIWQPYYSYDHNRRGAGIGLGLALVKAIADLHRGTCHVLSDESGTCVTIRLPRAGFSIAATLAQGARGHLNNRFSRLYVGLTDAVASPYRE